MRSIVRRWTERASKWLQSKDIRIVFFCMWTILRASNRKRDRINNGNLLCMIITFGHLSYSKQTHYMSAFSTQTEKIQLGIYNFSYNARKGIPTIRLQHTHTIQTRFMSFFCSVSPGQNWFVGQAEIIVSPGCFKWSFWCIFASIHK